MNKTDLEHLEHIFIPIKGGGEIIVVDPGNVIDAEALAMLQALHSRSIGGFRSHLKTLREKGAKNFMSNYYVGYGHKSIGDCGFITVFIEGVSMLVAKAIQDQRLYNGQEASTRYIDFKVQPFINPLKTAQGKELLENMRSFYIESMPIVVSHLKEKYPLKEAEEESVYDKAINARAFDILRGFLPAGATTNLTWTTNLRQADDKLKILRHHPLEEVRNVADAIEKGLQQAYPHSFGHKRYSDTEEYLEKSMKQYYYCDTDCPDFALIKNNVDKNELADYEEILSKRPAKTELSLLIESTGEMEFKFLLDFGSFRDIQRHRAVNQRMPLLGTDLGFERWYLDELPFEVEIKARSLVASIEVACKEGFLRKVEPEVQQYYIPMGYRCSCKVTGNLRAITYLVELRATRFVHPTLRTRAKQMAKILKEEFSSLGFVLHLDEDMDRFDVQRGEHDIQLK